MYTHAHALWAKLLARLQVGRSTLLSKLCGLTAGCQEPHALLCCQGHACATKCTLSSLLIDPPQESLLMAGWMDGSISDTNAWRIDGFGCDGFCSYQEESVKAYKCPSSVQVK